MQSPLTKFKPLEKNWKVTQLTKQPSSQLWWLSIYIYSQVWNHIRGFLKGKALELCCEYQCQNCWTLLEAALTGCLCHEKLGRVRGCSAYSVFPHKGQSSCRWGLQCRGEGQIVIAIVSVPCPPLASPGKLIVCMVMRERLWENAQLGRVRSSVRLLFKAAR